MEAAEVPEKMAAEVPEKLAAEVPEKLGVNVLEKEAGGLHEKEVNLVPEKELNGLPEKKADEMPEKEANGVPEKEVTGVPEKETHGIPEKEVNGAPEKEPAGVPKKKTSGVPEKELCAVLIDAGIQLLVPSENVDELLEHLNSVEALLSLLRQDSSCAVRAAIMPIKNGLISAKVFGHVSVDVRVLVLSCIHQLMRLTAPEAPYENDAMKVIFQQTLSLLETNLTLFSGSCYKKALQILETSAKVRSCLILLDIGCEPLVTQMFQLFLGSIRPKHPEAVFTNMENIMTRLIDESDELSMDLLKPLLTSIKKENQIISPLSWKLGMTVLNKCSSRVMPFLKKSVEQMRLDADNFTNIGASIWPDAFIEDNVTKEAAVQTSEPEEMPGDDILEKNKDNNCESMDEDFSKALVCYDKNLPLQVIPTEPAQPEAFESGDSLLKRKRRGGKTSSEVSRKRKSNGKPGGSPKRLLLENSSLKSKSIPTNQSSRGRGQPKKVTTRNKAVKKEPDLKTTAQNFDAEEALLKSFKGSGIQEYDEKLIGSRVKVWWPSDREFYTGTVESYDPSRKKHKVVYVDGDVECLFLKKERWFLLDDLATKQDQDVKPQSSALVPFKSGKKKASQPAKEGNTTGSRSKKKESTSSALVPFKSEKKKASQPAKEGNSTGSKSKKKESASSRSKKKEGASSSKKRLPKPRVRKSGNASLSISAQAIVAIKAELEDTSENKKEKTLSEIIRYTRRPKPERALSDMVP